MSNRASEGCEEEETWKASLSWNDNRIQKHKSVQGEATVLLQNVWWIFQKETSADSCAKRTKPNWLLCQHWAPRSTFLNPLQHPVPENTDSHSGHISSALRANHEGSHLPPLKCHTVLNHTHVHFQLMYLVDSWSVSRPTLLDQREEKKSHGTSPAGCSLRWIPDSASDAKHFKKQPTLFPVGEDRGVFWPWLPTFCWHYCCKCLQHWKKALGMGRYNTGWREPCPTCVTRRHFVPAIRTLDCACLKLKKILDPATQMKKLPIHLDTKNTTCLVVGSKASSSNFAPHNCWNVTKWHSHLQCPSPHGRNLKNMHSYWRVFNAAKSLTSPRCPKIDCHENARKMQRLRFVWKTLGNAD